MTKEVYESIRSQTEGIYCEDLSPHCPFCRSTGNKVISASELKDIMGVNEQTLYANLSTIHNWKGIKQIKLKIRRTQNGKVYTFAKSYWWYKII